MRFKLFAAAFAAAFLLIAVPAHADIADVPDVPPVQDADVQDPSGDDTTQDKPDDGSGDNGQDEPIKDDETKPGDTTDIPNTDPSLAPDTVEGGQATITTTITNTETVSIDKQDMHRLYNPNSGEHFYTASTYERDHLIDEGWNYEGIGWMAPLISDYPVYRLYNSYAGDHHYTLSEYERNHLIGIGWNDEGIGWYSAKESEGLPVLRQYNPNAVAGAHNFTTSEHENSSLVDAGWNAEGVAWHALKTDKKTIETSTSSILEKAPYLTATFTAPNGSVPETIVSYAKGRETYLFLPSYAPLDKVYLSAHESKAKTTNLLIDKNGSYVAVNPERTVDLLALATTKDANGILHLNFKTTGDGTLFPLTIMRSANISTIYINSNNVVEQGRDFIEADPEHNTKASVAVYMVDADGSVVYAKDTLGGTKKELSTIKGRGNSTWGNGIKKPYQINLSSKSALIEETSAAKKWILLANSADASLLHSSVAFDLAAELGLATVSTRPVDLYYDGEYRGSYLLTEKIEINDGRVDIFDLEEAIENANPNVELDELPTGKAKNKYGNEFQFVAGVQDPASIEGGYLLELDNGYYADETSWFTAKWGDGSIAHFVLKSPEYASRKTLIFISEAMQEAINNLTADKLADGAALSDGTFAFDLDSFAKMYLLEEFLKNNDTYTSSTYFYLERGSKIFRSGPVWDFDAGMGTRIDAHDSIQSTYWGYYLDPRGSILSSKVKKRVQDIYTNTFKDLIEKVVLGNADAMGSAGKLHSIAYYANQITPSQRMNEVPFGVTSFAFQAEPFASWKLNVDFFKQWLGWRTEWFTQNINMLGSATLLTRTRTNRWYQNVDYGFVFDHRYYLEQNPELAKLGINTSYKALQHFVTYGMHDEKYAGKTARNFDVLAYMENNPELELTLGDDLSAWYLHYCTEGFKKGLVCWEV